jgi:hypothetical protein
VIGVLLALASGPGVPRAAEPTTPEDSIELLARLVILQNRCPKAGLSYLALGLVLQRTGVTDVTLEKDPHKRMLDQSINRQTIAFGNLPEAEACALLFESYGARGTDVAGLAIESHPNDPFAFFNAIGRGIQNLKRLGTPDSKDPPK